MSTDVFANYFVLRRTDTHTQNVQYLYAYVSGSAQHEKPLSLQSWEKPAYYVGDGPVWFPTLSEAKKRLKVKKVTADARFTHIRWDIVEVTLVRHTKVVHTTVEDVVSKLGLLAEGLSETNEPRVSLVKEVA